MNKKIAYTHYFKDKGDFKAGKRYCFAGTESRTAQDICSAMGTPFSTPGTWVYYELP